MATIDEILNKKKQYTALFDKLSTIKKNINATVEKCAEGERQYKDGYTINDITADGNNLSSINNNLTAISKKIEVVMNKISIEISKLNKDINNYNMQDYSSPLPPAPDPSNNRWIKTEE